VNVQELGQLIDVVKFLRSHNIDSEPARILEREVCYQMLLLCPYKSGCSQDVLYPGVPKEVVQAVIVGILQGRPRDTGLAPILQNSTIWRSWERQAGLT
jgi:hypothetical protein